MKAIGTILVILFIVGTFGLIYYHESTHVEVFRHYDIEAKVEWIKYFPDVATVPEEECPEKECVLVNNISDIVGYHIMAFYFAIVPFLVLLILIIYRGLTED